MDGSLKDDVIRIAAMLDKHSIEFRDGSVNLDLVSAHSHYAETPNFTVVGVEVYDATHDQTKRKFTVYRR